MIILFDLKADQDPLELEVCKSKYLVCKEFNGGMKELKIGPPSN